MKVKPYETIPGVSICLLNVISIAAFGKVDSSARGDPDPGEGGVEGRILETTFRGGSPA